MASVVRVLQSPTPIMRARTDATNLMSSCNARRSKLPIQTMLLACVLIRTHAAVDGVFAGTMVRFDSDVRHAGFELEKRLLDDVPA
jgi:hypothetical protein